MEQALKSVLIIVSIIISLTITFYLYKTATMYILHGDIVKLVKENCK